MKFYQATAIMVACIAFAAALDMASAMDTSLSGSCDEIVLEEIIHPERTLSGSIVSQARRLNVPSKHFPYLAVFGDDGKNQGWSMILSFRVPTASSGTFTAAQLRIKEAGVENFNPFHWCRSAPCLKVQMSDPLGFGGRLRLTRDDLKNGQLVEDALAGEITRADGWWTIPIKASELIPGEVAQFRLRMLGAEDGDLNINSRADRAHFYRGLEGGSTAPRLELCTGATTSETTVAFDDNSHDTDPAIVVVGDAPTVEFGPDSIQGDPAAGKTEFYLNPLDLFGRVITVGDIDNISFYTKKVASETSDWFLNIYTPPYVGQTAPAGWYGNRFNAFPPNANNIDAPADQWNLYSTSGTTNVLQFADTSFNNFTPIGDFTTFIGLTNADGRVRSTEEVMLFYMGTDSGKPTFAGQMDGLTITLLDGSVATVNFGDSNA